MIFTVFFYLFVVFTAIQLLYYFFFSTVLFKSKKNSDKRPPVPVSVIVFSKNSADFLEKNLPYFLQQEYPEFEILLVNNASVDNTDNIIERFKEQHNAIKVIDVENNEAFWGNKKYALTLAIKAAKHEHLLFTEANCKPVSKFWIAKMSSNFTSKKGIVLGYKKFASKNTLSNILIRFDNLLTALKCFSSVKFNIPFMAYAHNYGYKKATFFEVKGFINHIKIRNGEDDLFVRDAATDENTTFEIDAESYVEIEDAVSFKDWYLKKRNLNVLQKHYKTKHRFLLHFFTLSKACFYALGIVLLFFYPTQIILPIFLSGLLAQYIIIGLSAKKFKEPYLILLLPFLELALLFIQISIFIVNLISKPNHWK